MKVNEIRQDDFKFVDFSKDELRTNLARISRICENFKIPVLILIDGWESSGRGYIVSQLSKDLNPKYFDVDVAGDNPDYGDYSFIRDAWVNSPAKSHIKIQTKSYYYDLFENLDADKDEIKAKVEEIENFEKMLTDDQAIVIKIFLDIDEKTQKERLEDLKDSYKQSFYVKDLDKKQVKNHKNFKKNFKSIIGQTSFDFARWNVIEASDTKNASKEVLGILSEILTLGIERVGNQQKDETAFERSYDKKSHTIENLDLEKAMDDEEYQEKKDKLQEEVAETMYKLYDKGIASALVFEGVDAAGKDGAIKRLIKDVDPRLYTVHAISAPTELELSHHYLWRFYKRLAKKGYVSIFSRSWYGRVMVERIEGFASIGEWDRAFEEIKKFEKFLVKNKTMVLKFFVVIDKDVQLERFKDREIEPDKRYKITDEDWRNREKWDPYIEAMNEMLDRTTTDYAPWIVVEGNDKKYARIKVMEEYLAYAKKFLKEID